MDQIVVSPEIPAWYWVTTVDGWCEETASVLVVGGQIFLDGFESGDTTAWSVSGQNKRSYERNKKFRSTTGPR